MTPKPLRKNCYWLSDLPQRGSVSKQAFGAGWWELDKIFKFYLGQFVVCTGIAGSGKSTFLMNLLLRVAQKDGVGCFLYTPENEAYLYEKLRKIWGGDDGTFEHFASTQCRVQSAIPVDHNEPPHTMDWILNEAADAVQEDRLEMVMIDPWNELERARPKDMLMTDYIGECLMQVKDFCRTLNVVVIVVAHPTKAGIEKGKTPTLADIEGSMNWFNKADNGLIVVREFERNRVQVISAKVRELGAGKIGSCYFKVDAETGIFLPEYGAVQAHA